MALMKVKGNIERLFDKNLNDLVRGIRNHKEDEGKYIASCLEEIKAELRQHNLSVKTNAVAKLTYLQVLGYDISWAGFNIIEVMSSTKFTEKRIGYLSACQSFHKDTEVLMLTTNMIRKDLNSQNLYDAGVALSSLACFMSPDLARDLSADIMSLLSSTRPYLRKKAVLILYKVFLRYPDALRPAFPRLKEKLEDPDPGVQSAAVNVICELARKNPKNYLSLAPTFFKLMTSSTNNWMLIKIIKLFGALTPLEPRLGKKLIEPLTSLIHSTSAMSLLYECINTVIAVLISISSGMPNHTAAIQLCVQKLRILIEDSDQNLKYLGLLAMSKILKTNPKSVQGHKDLVMQCLDDSDDSIRLRALDLLYGMVSKKNLMEIVKKLMAHMEKAEGTTYRDELMHKTIQICSQNDYQYITNFEWYVTVLVELAQVTHGSKHGPLIASQMMDVTIRVESIRTFAVKQMSLLLQNHHLLVGHGRGGCSTDVLYAASWICGEFAALLEGPEATLKAMCKRSRVMALPGHVQATYIQNAMKLYAHIIVGTTTKANTSDPEKSCDYEEVDLQGAGGSNGGDATSNSREEVTSALSDALKVLTSSSDLEVQERATVMQQFVKYVGKQLAKAPSDNQLESSHLEVFFAGELNPVAPKAQRKVPVPEGLDLDAWINEPPPEPSDEEEHSDSDESSKALPSKTFSFMGKNDVGGSPKKSRELTEEEVRKVREARIQQQQSDPNYLKGGLTSSSSLIKNSNITTADVDSIPIRQLSDVIPGGASGVPSLLIPGLASADQYFDPGSKKGRSKKKKKDSKRKKHRKGSVSSAEEDENTVEGSGCVVPSVLKAAEMPEGAELSDGGDDHDDGSDEESVSHRALRDISLDDVVSESRQNGSSPVSNDQSSKRRKHKKKEKKSKHSKKSADEVAEEIVHNSVIPDPTDDVNFWLGNDTNGVQQKPSSTKPSSTKPSSTKPSSAIEDILAGVSIAKENGVESVQDTTSGSEELKKGRKLLIESDVLRLSCQPSVIPSSSSTDSANLDLKFVIESRSGSKEFSDLKIELSNSKHATVISSGGSEDRSLAAKGQRVVLSCKVQISDDFVKSALEGEISYDVKKTSSSKTSHKSEDFSLPISHLDLLEPLGGTAVADLLAQGSLSASTSKRKTLGSEMTKFKHVMKAVKRETGFAAVEEMEDSAYLGGKLWPGGTPVALLLKFSSGSSSSKLAVDGKSSDQEALSKVMKDFSDILS